MSLLNPWLLVGLLLMAAPVVLHLLLRNKPKQLPFPALQLLLASKRNTMRKIQLRHWWLLLLRMFMIGLLAFGLSRPTLPAGDYFPHPWEWARTIAIVALVAAASLASMARVPTKASPWIAQWGPTAAMGIGAILLWQFVGWPYQQRVAAAMSESKPPITATDLPAAALLLFDVSQSMDYLQAGQSRLADASELGRRLIGRLPSASKVAVWDTASDDPAVFVADLAAAENRLTRLTTTPAVRRLDERIVESLAAHHEDRERVLGQQGHLDAARRQDRFVREIYVFTDLARHAWRLDAATSLQQALTQHDDVSIYLIDVGAMAPQNVGIVRVRPTREVATAGATVGLDVELSASGVDPVESTVDWYVAGESGDMVKQGSQAVTITPGTNASVRFLAEGGSGRFRQGEVRLSGSDPLPSDDRGYFSWLTRTPIEVLVLSEQLDDARFWAALLDQEELRKQGRSRYRCTVERPLRLKLDDLPKYQVVCLLDAAGPSPEVWDALGRYVKAGGGLLVTLGAPSQLLGNAERTINPVAYNGAEAKSVLPASLVASLKFPAPLPAQWRAGSHPVLKRLEELTILPNLGLAEISRYWSVEPRSDATVLVQHGDNRSPLLLEYTSGRGRAMLFTSSVTSPEWNDYALGDNVGSLLVLTDLLVQHLSQANETRVNTTIGSSLELPRTNNDKLAKYLLRMPGLRQRVGEATSALSLTIDGLTEPGNYQLAAADTPQRELLGFSVNATGAESQLTRLTLPELETLFGKDRLAVSRDLESLERKVRASRLGQELFGMVLALLMTAFVSENLLANWFYGAEA